MIFQVVSGARGCEGYHSKAFCCRHGTGLYIFFNVTSSGVSILAV